MPSEMDAKAIIFCGVSEFQYCDGLELNTRQTYNICANSKCQAKIALRNAKAPIIYENNRNDSGTATGAIHEISDR